MPGGSVNLTCVAVGAPMPYVKWMAGVEELTKEDEMPVGRNVLELNNIMQSANYTCVAISSLGMIEATAQITVKALPKPPTEPLVTETTATSVTLTWDSGNSDPISYYVIQYKPKSLEGQFQEVDGVATTRYSIGGLSPFSEYEFRVIAVNNIGRGPPSELVEARTGEQAPSSPPLKVQARMLSASTMLVQWEQPEEPNGQIRGYRVYYTTDPHLPLSMWQKHNTDDSHLTTPADFQAEAESDTRILLTWLPASQERITKYELLYWEGEDGTQQKVEFDPTSSYAVEGLKPDTLYKFRLGARSELGAVEGDDNTKHVVDGIGREHSSWEIKDLEKWTEYKVWGKSMCVLWLVAVPSAPPRKVEVESVNSTAIRVSWKLPISNKQHGQIRGYQVTYVKLENNEPRGQPVIKDVMLSEAQMRNGKRVKEDERKKWRAEDSVDHETVIGGLLPETTYSVTVAAYTTKGDGARSKPKVITTTGAGECGEQCHSLVGCWSYLRLELEHPGVIWPFPPGVVKLAFGSGTN
ncbi:hypothetical protein EK904_000569 [Melospiza melodia maxima]|nr:hypothetical protein EK904_000569 [Melospiza melodia maxima]